MGKKLMKMLVVGIFFLLVGSLFLFLENTFYQYLDEEGFLHESLFLPLGSFAIIIGLMIVFIYILKKIWQYFITKNIELK